MFVGDWMARGAQYWPDRVAVVDAAKDARFTYSVMNDRANALARFLRGDGGVGRGDRVGVLAHNGVEYLDALFACAKLGAILVPFNWRLHAAELAELFRDTRPKVLFHGAEFAELVQQASLTGAPEVRRVDVESAAYVSAVARPGSPVANEAVDAEDTLCLLFTGGTTGRSKGARISYRMVAWNTLNTLIHELLPRDVTLTHTPMFHTGGLLVYTLPLLTSGGTAVVMRRWDPEELLSLIEREKVSVFFAVPAQYQQLVQSPSFARTSFSSVRFMTSGGAPLPVTLIEDFRSVHPVPFKQGFGMTEAGPGLFSMGPEFAVSKAGSIGKPNYFVEAKLVDDGGREVATGEMGELVLKGPVLFSGYFNDAAASRAAFDGQGWFHTGDVAKKDADGFFFIVDRKKDMFISGGENVYPVEVEQALYAHPAVHQCAVVGIPDERWGEVGLAVVVRKPGAEVSEEQLLAGVRTRLARYKVPRRIEFRDALPLSPAGKILKRELREQLTERSPTKQEEKP